MHLQYYECMDALLICYSDYNIYYIYIAAANATAWSED